MFKALGQPWLFLLAAGCLDTTDEQAGNRPTNQAAQHQAKRCRSHCQLRGRGQTELLAERRPPCSTCTVTTCQSNRACQQAHQRIEPQRRCEPDAHGILDHQKSDNRQQKDPHYASALLQAGEVCAQANRGKKRQHQGSLQRGIKSDFNIESSQSQKTQGNHQAACYRFRDIIST
ncbi:hypothetical protein D3C84_698880 [compost metagenome]